MCGACIGSICQRTATSTCIPICSLESALICSASPLLRGNCFSRVENRSTLDQGVTNLTPARSGWGSTSPKA